MKLLVKKVSGVTTVTFIFSGDGEEHRYTLDADMHPEDAAALLTKIVGHLGQGFPVSTWEDYAEAVQNDTAPYEPQVEAMNPEWAAIAKQGVGMDEWDDPEKLANLPLVERKPNA